MKREIDGKSLAWDWVNAQQAGVLIRISELVEEFQITRACAKHIMFCAISNKLAYTVFKAPCTNGEWIPHMLALASIDVVETGIEVAFMRA